MKKLEIVYKKISDLRRNPRNCKDHPPEQIAELRESIRLYGFNDPLDLDAQDEIIGGHGRIDAAELEGMVEVPCVVLAHLNANEKRAYAIAVNRIPEGGKWNWDLLSEEVSQLLEVGVSPSSMGFDDATLDALLKENPAAAGDMNIGATQPPAPPVIAPVAADLGEPSIPKLNFVVTAPGDMWIMGKHRIMCGDSTNGERVRRLIEDIPLDLIITDPPGCSLSQESEKENSKSVVKRRNDSGKGVQAALINDNLSQRGYSALVKSALSLYPAPFLYCFTDWRMFVTLSDIAESCTFLPRNMLIWNKGSAGMGFGWRHQHEIIFFGSKKMPAFEKKRSGSNVLNYQRPGNAFHPKQKPVDLIRELLRVTHFAKNVADPFTGSGSTLIACEHEGRCCYAMELSERDVDTTVLRWQQMTGLQAIHADSGKTFEEVIKRRHG